MHLPFESGTFRMAMGLTSVPQADWIETDDAVPTQIAARVAEAVRAMPDDMLAYKGMAPFRDALLGCLA